MGSSSTHDLPTFQPQELYAELPTVMSQGSFGLPRELVAEGSLEEEMRVEGGSDFFLCLLVVSKKENAQTRPSVGYETRTLKVSHYGCLSVWLQGVCPEISRP